MSVWEDNKYPKLIYENLFFLLKWTRENSLEAFLTSCSMLEMESNMKSNTHERKPIFFEEI